VPTGPPWWQEAVFYQIYPRSFADSDGDGVGDLAGIRAHLDDLAWLGVDALWISPFYPSPMVDFGYDISDYCDVDPLFGSLDVFDRLVEEAHALGLKVIIDWVPNHTSDRHPWFVDARSGRDSAHRHWYVWRDARADGSPPNNWAAAFDPTAPAWTLDDASGQWYLHLFESAQPDLNWDEPEVATAMDGVLRFWLDRGVDGFRADVVHCIGKDPALPDDPEAVAGIPHCALNDVPVTHERLRHIRSVLDGYPGDRVMVGEVYLLSTPAVATYYGEGDELHLAFNFPPLYAPWRERAWAECIGNTVEAFDARGAWPTWVLSNHDNPRHRSRYDRAAARAGEDEATVARRSEPRARAAAVLLLTLRGTPFLYQGDELGLLDADVPEDRRVDPGGRDGCRAPIPWDGSDTHGWPTVDGVVPWLPFPPDAGTRNHADLRRDPSSALHLYRRLIALRHGSTALALGTFEPIELPEGLLGYRRFGDGEAWVVIVNFTDRPIRVGAGPLPDRLRVALASDGIGEGGPFDGSVGADQAVVLGN
jgi:alpha-glucosidase